MVEGENGERLGEGRQAKYCKWKAERSGKVKRGRSWDDDECKNETEWVTGREGSGEGVEKWRCGQMR